MPLPEKSRFTVQEIAGRWGVPPSTVEQYFEDGLLVPSIIIPSDLKALATYPTGREGLGKVFLSGMYNVKNFKLSELRAGKYLRFGFHDGPELERSGVIFNPEDSIDYRDKNELVITLQERDRFELEYGVNIAPKVPVIIHMLNEWDLLEYVDAYAAAMLLAGIDPHNAQAGSIEQGENARLILKVIMPMSTRDIRINGGHPEEYQRVNVKEVRRWAAEKGIHLWGPPSSEKSDDYDDKGGNLGVKQKKQVRYVGAPTKRRAEIDLEFTRRADSKELADSLDLEADYLRQWVEDTYPNENYPVAGTIKNTIRGEYRKHKPVIRRSPNPIKSP